jgi:YD repeat-containing protein
LAGGPVTTWSYDLDGNVTSTTDPLGNTTWTQYNSWNLPVAVTDALGAYVGDPQHTTTTTYDELRDVSAVTDPLGRTTAYLYDNLHRKIEEIDPAASVTPDGGGTPVSVSPTTYYGYDADGNLKYTTDPQGTPAAGGQGAADWNYTTWYFYDGLGREVCVIDPQSSRASSWTPSNVPDTISLSPQPNKSTLTTYDKLGQKRCQEPFVLKK